MRVAVLGAGVIGVTSAWYLARAGFEVVVIDRQPGAALETSFANGGQISASHAEPWANPQAIAKIVKWLGREDAPLLFRLRADLAQWRWGLRFLVECLPQRAQANTVQCLNLALYSRDCLAALRAETSIVYDALRLGILQFYTDGREFEHGVSAAEAMRAHGIDRQVQTPSQCASIEPALSAAVPRLAGGIYTASDESGDAQRFTSELARLCAARGVAFRWNERIVAIDRAGDRVTGVRVQTADGTTETLSVDAYVVALGSYSAPMLRAIGIASRVYPVKGYSATIEVGSHTGAPTVSLTDEAFKIVITRLGSRLRVAGTAELTGYDTSINEVRGAALVARTFELFPDAGERERVTLWAGLRPATPSNVPTIGRTRLANLWTNTGHGTLGWTMACGSARALADLMRGREPEVNFAFA